MLIAGIDVETTGLDPKEERITEIGIVLWCTELNTPIHFYNSFIDPEKPIPKMITELTGITDDLISKYAAAECSAAEVVAALLNSVNYIVAHNAPFDKSFIEAFLLRNKQTMEAKVWLDSSRDVKYKAGVKGRSLIHLAAEHGFVNPFPHRAVTDVLTMLRLLSFYDIKTIIERQAQPSVTYRAIGGFAIKDLAKSLGFNYNPDNKQWTISVKEGEVFELLQKCKQISLPVESI